ncbi:GNAT family N-acetyltransferase [Hymenobacter arcticus]
MDKNLTHHIGPATPADVPALADVINRAYRSEAASAGWTAEGHLLEGPRIDEATLQEMLAAPRTTLLKAETAAGSLVGCIYLEQQSKVLYFSMLAVVPEAQAHGLGRLLLEAIEMHARQAHCNLLKMSVLELRTELLAWYERRGYRRTGASEPFPATTRFGRPRQPLILLTLEKTVSSEQ